MNAQRYTPDELDQLATELRDEAIRDWMVRGASPDTERANMYLEIDSRVALATLLRRDAEQLRRQTRVSTDMWHGEGEPTS